MRSPPNRLHCGVSLSRQISRHCQYTRDDGERASRLFSDPSSEDAEPDPDARSIGRCNRFLLSLRDGRRPCKTSSLIANRPRPNLSAPCRCSRENWSSEGTRCSQLGPRSLPASAIDRASRRADVTGKRAAGRRFWCGRSWKSRKPFLYTTRPAAAGHVVADASLLRELAAFGGVCQRGVHSSDPKYQ